MNEEKELKRFLKTNGKEVRHSEERIKRFEKEINSLSKQIEKSL